MRNQSSKKKNKAMWITVAACVCVLALVLIIALGLRFASKEPVAVETPAAVTEEVVPMDAAITVLVSGDHTQILLSDEVDEAMRRDILNEICIVLDEEQIDALKTGDAIEIADLDDFQEWMQAVSKAAQKHESLMDGLNSGRALAVKADEQTDYTTLTPVLNALQAVGLRKFTILNSLK